jgi:hypothetical protein
VSSPDRIEVAQQIVALCDHSRRHVGDHHPQVGCASMAIEFSQDVAPIAAREVTRAQGVRGTAEADIVLAKLATR